MKYFKYISFMLLVAASALAQTLPNAMITPTVSPVMAANTGVVITVTLRISQVTGNSPVDGFGFVVQYDPNILAFVDNSFYLGTNSGPDQQWLSKPDQESVEEGYQLTSFCDGSVPGEVLVSAADTGHHYPQKGTVAASGFLVSFQLVGIAPGSSNIIPAPYGDAVLYDTDLHPTGTVQFYSATAQVRDAGVTPTVAITSPSEGAVFNAPSKIALSATASATNAIVTNVSFYTEGTTKLGESITPPYTINWSNPPSGSHTLTAVATDNYGGSAVSSNVHITVNAPGSISLTNPANNARFTAPANITMSATASDSDGSIARVEFYSGSTLRGTDTNAPYSITWSNVGVGNYVLTAKAIDNLGAETVSAPINISVIASNSPPHFVATAAILESETGGTLNGAIDPGETVRIRFWIKNDGGCDTVNLVGNLPNSGGVTSSSGSTNYGFVAAGGASVGQAFTFTASGTDGGTLTATLQLEEGSTSFTNLNFSFLLGTVSSTNAWQPYYINIRDNTNASPYPTTLSISGLAGVVNAVSVTLSNMTHVWPADVDILLVAPDGRTTLLMSDAGSGNAISGVTLTFDDAQGSLPQNNQISSGWYKPTDYGTNADLFLSPAPSGPYGKTLSNLRGSSPNGNWSLYVMDDALGGSGYINNGWILNITNMDPVSPVADLAIACTDIPDPVAFGSNVTYTVTVTNLGPEQAWGVLLSNIVPAGMNFISATPSTGSCSNASNTVVCDVGNLASNATASVTIVATATNVGTKTFIGRAYTVGNDFFTFNNNVTNTTTVNSAADLGVTLAATPNPVYLNNTLVYTVTVTNRGPNNASNVTMTNLLPSGVAFVSATPSQGSCSQTNGTVTCSLGTLNNGSKATITITNTSPGTVGTLTDQAGAYSATADPVGTNDTASLSIANLNPSFVIVPAAAWLVSESGPMTGGIDSNETVSVCFYLKNIGSVSTTNLTATLSASGGVTSPSPSGAQTYGVVEAGGWAVGRTNSFVASGTNGGLVTATLQIQEGAVNLGSVSFNFPLGCQFSRYNSSSISIPSSGSSSPYPASVSVAGINGYITKATVTVSNLTHTYLADVDMLLVGPTGQSTVLMSDAGGNSSVANLTLTFDDEASNSVPELGSVESGTYKPSNYGTSSDVFWGPAPQGPYGTNLAVFNGLSPNGEWSLYVVDDATSDFGQIDGGWTLNLTTGGIINPSAPTFTQAQVNTNQLFQFVLNGRYADKYLILASTNLTDWTGVLTNVTYFPSTTIDLNSTTNFGYRFYRALWKP